MSYDTLRGDFKQIMFNYQLILLFEKIIEKEIGFESLKKESFQYDNFRLFDVNALVTYMQNTNSKNIAQNVWETLGLRSTFREAYELIWNYSKKDQNLLAKLKSTDFWKYAKVIRDGLAHNYNFNLKTMKQYLPITWRGVSIDQTCDQQSLTYDHLNPAILMMMLDDMQGFIDSIKP